MLLLITGVCLLALGVFSGAVLVAVPLGIVPWSAGAVLWVLFPALCILGQVILLAGARHAHARLGARIVSALLLVLALASVAGLVLGSAGVAPIAGETLSLWYVMFVAGICGLIGAAVSARPWPSSTTSA